jgi:hypothetical protein
MSCCKNTDDESNSLSRVVPVVIVESHQHVLEHVHHVLRKQKLLSTNWSMVHFDAHPDMACPSNVPAAACFTPRCVSQEEDLDCCDVRTGDATILAMTSSKDNLYEMLDSTTSGIAEWILPLVLAGNLGHVEWIKPSFSNHFTTGDYHYCVGVEDKLTEHLTDVCFLDLSKHARIRVDICHPYYLDDFSVVPADNLVLKQGLHLRVSELSPKEIAMEASGPIPSHSQHKPWMLDICLDYFACVNPYIVDIEKISPFAATTFVSLMAAAKMDSARGEMHHDALQYQNHATNFYKLMNEIVASGSLSREYNGQLKHYFEDKNKAQKLIDTLVQRVKGHSSTLKSAILEAIPNWKMPHNNSDILTPQCIQDSLRLVEQAIEKRIEEHHATPFLVTIARSTSDGFTPLDVVEFLQTQVLAIIDKIFCQEDDVCVDNGAYAGRNHPLGEEEKHPCGYRLRVVRDYGQWEGSTIYDY